MISLAFSVKYQEFHGEYNMLTELPDPFEEPASVKSQDKIKEGGEGDEEEKHPREPDDEGTDEEDEEGRDNDQEEIGGPRNVASRSNDNLSISTKDNQSVMRSSVKSPLLASGKATPIGIRSPPNEREVRSPTNPLSPNVKSPPNEEEMAFSPMIRSTPNERETASIMSGSRKRGFPDNASLTSATHASSHHSHGTVAGVKFPYEFKHLTYADLSYNQFQVINDRLNIFASLIDLDLSHNSLIEFTDHSFHRLKHLRTLDLSYNQLMDLPMSLGEGCGSSLNILNISYNRFMYLPKCLGRCTRLVTLTADHNNIQEIDGKIVTMFYDIEQIYLQYNEIETLPLMFFSISKPITVDFSYNKIVYLPDDFSNWVQLKYCDFSYNRLQAIPFTVGQLANTLTTFLLQNNQIKELPTSIYQLKKLEKLTLQFNQISKPAYLLYTLPLLKHVDISHNAFEYVDDKDHHYIYVKKRSVPSAVANSSTFRKEAAAVFHDFSKPKSNTEAEEATTDNKEPTADVSAEKKKKSKSERAREKEEAAKPKETTYEEMIFDIPHIRRECMKLREYYDVVAKKLPHKEKDHYYQFFAAAKAKEDGEIEMETAKRPPDGRKKEAGGVSNKDLFVKWLRKLRLHFNLSDETFEGDQLDEDDDESTHDKRSFPNKPFSQSFSYSYSYSSSFSQKSGKEESKEKALIPSSKSEDHTMDLVPWAPQQQQQKSVANTPSGGSGRKFFGFGGAKQQATSPPSAQQTLTQPANKFSQSLSDSFEEVSSAKKNKHKQAQAAAAAADEPRETLEGKIEKVLSSGKLTFQSPIEINQCYLYYLLSKWRCNAMLRSQFLLTHFQLLTNRSLLDYNFDINNPVQYLPPPPPPAGSQDNNSGPKKGNTASHGEGEKYQYNKTQSLLQQNLTLSSRKQLEKKLFGLGHHEKLRQEETSQKKKSRSNDYQSIKHSIYEPIPSQDEYDDDNVTAAKMEAKRSQTFKIADPEAEKDNFDKSNKLFNEMFFSGGSELFEIIDHCCELLSLTNIFVFLEEFHQMKKKHLIASSGASGHQADAYNIEKVGVVGPWKRDHYFPEYENQLQQQIEQHQQQQQAQGLLATAAAAAAFSPLGGTPGVQSPLRIQSPPTIGSPIIMSPGSPSDRHTAALSPSQQGVMSPHQGLTSPHQGLISPLSPSDSVKLGGAVSGSNRMSLFSSNKKEERRRVSDNDRVLNKKLTDFQRQLQQQMNNENRVKKFAELTNLFPPPADQQRKTGSFKPKDTSQTVEEIMKQYGNYINTDDLLQELIYLHYQYYHIPSSSSSSSRAYPPHIKGLGQSTSSTMANLLRQSMSTSFDSAQHQQHQKRQAHSRSQSMGTFSPISVNSFMLAGNNPVAAPHSIRSEKSYPTMIPMFAAVFAQQQEQLAQELQSTEQLKGNIFMDHLPIMSLPLSIIHQHQDQLVRNRYLSDNFGDAHVPLNEVQLPAKDAGFSTFAPSSMTGAAIKTISENKGKKNKKERDLLLKQRELTIKLKHSFHYEMPVTNSSITPNRAALNRNSNNADTETSSFYLQRMKYAMLTESNYQDQDVYGSHSIFSCLLEVYSLLVNCLFLHIEYIEKFQRMIERVFIHQRIINSNGAMNVNDSATAPGGSVAAESEIGSNSKPFSFTQLFSSIDLPQRFHYYAVKKEDYRNKKKVEQQVVDSENDSLVDDESSVVQGQEREAGNKKKGDDLELEKKEDLDDIFYDIYLQLNMNTIREQKSQQQKQQSSISHQKMQMVQGFLSQFYSSLDLAALGISPDDEEGTNNESAAGTSFVDKTGEGDKETGGLNSRKGSKASLAGGSTANNKAAEPNKDSLQRPESHPDLKQHLKKQGSVSSAMSGLTVDKDPTAPANDPPPFKKQGSLDSFSSLFSLAQGQQQPLLSIQEAQEYIELLSEYRTLMYMFTLQILENSKEILCYRGFSSDLIFQHYMRKRGDEEDPRNNTNYHKTLLNIIHRETQLQDYRARNSSLFSNKVLQEEKALSVLLQQYKHFVRNYGKVFQGLGIYSSAIDCYYQYIQLSRGSLISKDFYLTLVKIFLSQGNYFKANQVIKLVIKKFIMAPNEAAKAASKDELNDDEESEAEDLQSISSMMTYTPLELLNLDREIAIYYFYLLTQYDIFQDHLGFNLNTQITKLTQQQQFQQQFRDNKLFYSNLTPLLPNQGDDQYLYKIQNMEKLILSSQQSANALTAGQSSLISHENLYGRNLNDKKYKTYLQQQEKKKEEKQKEKEQRMKFHADISLVKSKALLLLENEMVSAVLK